MSKFGGCPFCAKRGKMLVPKSRTGPFYRTVVNVHGEIIGKEQVPPKDYHVVGGPDCEEKSARSSDRH